MRRKLSHPTEAPAPGIPFARTRHGHLTAKGWLALSAAILLWTGTACDDGEAGRPAAVAGPGAHPDDTSFPWPEAPDPPVLSLDVEGPQGAGTIEIELMPELAPKTIAHVLDLARQGSYDGTTFHRVIPGFMIQGGDPNSRDRDPTNDGRGGFAVTVEDEFGEAPLLRGVVAMANKGREDSAGSQFFIMLADDHALDGRFTVIGRVRSGMDVVDGVATVETDEGGRWGPKNRPIVNVVMTRVRVEEGTGGVTAVPRTLEAGNADTATGQPPASFDGEQG